MNHVNKATKKERNAMKAVAPLIESIINSKGTTTVTVNNIILFLLLLDNIDLRGGLYEVLYMLINHKYPLK
ncbi:MAG: hypothetical protein DRN04_08295 [Thermoprotei archaeon]|nr:MAG: hypothetical protein DRN04_08295 [Thermoprotei archaeon]